MIDLSLIELLSRNVDSERIVLERPVVTVRLGDDGKKAEPKPKAPRSENPNPKPRRDVKLKDIRIEDGTVNIVYDETGKERRVEHINANLALPSAHRRPSPARASSTGRKQSVDFSFELNSIADLREKRPARLLVVPRHKGNRRPFRWQPRSPSPTVSGQGELSAKAHSIPSLLAWMREKPASVTGIGDGELSSHVAWKKGEITFSNSRFALEHASGQGQAVVSLRAPRPHVRAALALDHLDLNPFLASASEGGEGRDKAVPVGTGRGSATGSPGPQGQADWFTQAEGKALTQARQTRVRRSRRSDGQRPRLSATAVRRTATSAAPAPVASSAPASFDADVNLNVRKTRLFHLELGPSSLGLAFRDGVLNATLGGMELYDGHATGKLVFDASRDVPAFNGDFLLDGVQIKSLLSDAAQVSLLEGRTKLALQLSGAGEQHRGDQVLARGPGQHCRERRRDRGRQPHRDDRSDRRGRDPGAAPGARRQDRVHRSRRQLHHQGRHCRDEQSHGDEPAARK